MHDVAVNESVLRYTDLVVGDVLYSSVGVFKGFHKITEIDVEKNIIKMGGLITAYDSVGHNNKVARNGSLISIERICSNAMYVLDGMYCRCTGGVEYCSDCRHNSKVLELALLKYDKDIKRKDINSSEVAL